MGQRISRKFPVNMSKVSEVFDLAKTHFGIVGCSGQMGSSLAILCASQGLPIFLASRNPSKAKKMAEQLNEQAGAIVARSGTHAELLSSRPTITWLAMGPDAIAEFIGKHRDEMKGLNFGEMTAWFASVKWGNGRPCPEPHVTTCTYFKELSDPSTKWVKCWQSVMASSIANNKQQPMEVAGDTEPKEISIKFLSAIGWEPLDCGGPKDARLLERQGPEQMKHPRQAEDDGEMRKWYPTNDRSTYPVALAEKYKC